MGWNEIFAIIATHEESWGVLFLFYYHSFWDTNPGAFLIVFVDSFSYSDWLCEKEEQQTTKPLWGFREGFKVYICRRVYKH